MPFLHVQTNQKVDPAVQQDLLTQATEQVSSMLGKSEDFFMSSFQTVDAMRFGGNDEPAAMFDLKGLGIPSESVKPLSKVICKLSSEILNVDKARTYVIVRNVDRGLWGWNDKVF